MDSFIYALVLAPAMRELLPAPATPPRPKDVAFAGSLLFGLFLVGWGLSFIWGPIADRFGRTRTLAGTVLIYSVFTGAAALADNVWQLGLFRFLAGIGIGGEWAMAGTYVAEAWPEDRRRQGAGYLQTGYYAGFFVAAVLNATVGASFGWRAMFLCGLAPVIVSVVTLLRVKEPARWQQAHGSAAPRRSPLAVILSGHLLSPHHRQHHARRRRHHRPLGRRGLRTHRRDQTRHRRRPETAGRRQRTASYATGLLSIGTILGCLILPTIADRIGRRWCLAIYLRRHGHHHRRQLRLGLLPPAATALPAFMTVLFFLGCLRRQFRPLQPLAPRTIRHRCARHRLRLLHLHRPLHRRRRELRAGRRRAAHGHAWHTPWRSPPLRLHWGCW